MSGKKLKSIPGWFDCSKCKRRISRQLATKHSGTDDGACRPVYPYLKNDKLFCLLSTVIPATRKIGDLPFIKDKRIASSTIFLSEDLIKEFGLTTFGWIALTSLTAHSDPPSSNSSQLGDTTVVAVSEGDELPVTNYAFRVWPIPESIGGGGSNLLAVLSVEGFGTNKLVASPSQLDGSGDAPLGLVTIQMLSSSVRPVSEVFSAASEVTLVIENFEEIDQVSFDIGRFVDSFKRIFLGRPVAPNNRFRIRFYAQFIHFYISKLVNVEGQGDDDGVTSALQNLSISESQSLQRAFLQIDSDTVINVVSQQNTNLNEASSIVPRVTLADVGGLGTVLNEICSTVKFILNTQLDVAKGILLYGHIGVGKSLVVEAISNEFQLFQIHYEEFKLIRLGGKNDQSSIRSSSLSKIFTDAVARQPSVIIVDGLDIVAPKKNSDVGAAPMTQFAADFSRLVSSKQFQTAKVLILCTATNLERVDTNMRSQKIFAKEIEIPVPSAPEREKILLTILRKMSHNLSEQDVKVIASSTHGFVAADLRSLCNQASLDAVTNRKGGAESQIGIDNIQECMKSVKPSAIKSILIDVPNVKWEDIGGQDDLKFKLKQAIEWPLKHPESFRRLGIVPPKGILMYGPPGCSKTMIAKAIATESGLNFISVKGSELFSKWVGESEKAVQAIFRKARQVAPCVVFFDEIDSLGGERGTSSGSSNVHERVLAQILVEIDGIEALKDVTIVAATNRPDRIDQALLRPGRLDRIIYVPLPDDRTRGEILKIRFKKMPIDEGVLIEELVQSTKGYSGAELTAVCHEAALKALEEDISSTVIKQRHFQEALSIVKPRITQDQIDFYEKYSISRQKV